MNEKLVFLHIPKNGGTSLTSLLSSWFPKDRVCPYRDSQDYVSNFSDDDLNRFDYFTGHLSVAIMRRYLPLDCAKLALLREPVDRIYSLYAYWRTYELPKAGVIEKREKGVVPTLYANELQGPLMAQEHSLGSFLFSDNPYIKRVLNNPQSRFLCDPKYTNQLDTIDPQLVFDNILENVEKQNITVEVLENQESLVATLGQFSKQFGVTQAIEFPHRNKSERTFFEGLDVEQIADYLRLVSPIDFMLHDHFSQS
ncbi:MAG: sulfotransferase family 2 domain-containing protein [Proteobacteria bacterium]|nr:sulfotransferase family 2 domain-containing protein [Pseudomonadota bacterium]